MNTKDKTVSSVLEAEESVLKPVVPKKTKGPPKKAEIAKRIRKDPTRGRGRPPGEAQKIKELMARMLLTNGEHVLKKTIDMALNDDHPHQMAAIRLLMDRALPVSYFEQKDNNGAGSGIVINISGLSTQVKSTSDLDDNIIDVGVSDV